MANSSAVFYSLRLFSTGKKGSFFISFKQAGSLDLKPPHTAESV